MKSLMKVAAAALLSLTLVACGSGETKSDNQNSAPKEDKAGEKTLINIGSAPSSTSWYTYFSALSGAINEASDVVETSVIEAGGTKTNAINLAQKKQDVGFTEAFVAYESYNEEGRFNGEKAPGNPDLRLLWYAAPSSLHWAVTKESGIKTLEELNGKEFNPSSLGGGGEYITMNVFEELGIKPEYKRMKLGEAAELVQNGQLNGFSYNGTPPIPKFTEVNTQQPLHILSLTEEQRQQVLDKFPFFVARTIPAESYEGVDAAETIGLYMGVAANKGVSEEVAYEMTKAYWENIDKIATSFPLVEGTTPQETIDNATAPLHSGAIKYYEEAGFTVPDELKVD
jgi:TRAP transporter TAXI family solute receptor